MKIALCENCGKPYEKIRTRMKFCGRACSAEYNSNRTHDDFIIKSYINGVSSDKIAKETNLSKPTILAILRRNQVIIRSNRENSRKYAVNHDYFESIDSRNKAALLGLIYSDGYITSSYGKKIVGIKMKDSDCNRIIFTQLLEALDSDYPIREGKSTTGYSGSSEFIRIEIVSEKMYDDLLGKGVLPNKSLTLKFPSSIQVPSKFLNDFIGGYFAGDGAFKKRKVHVNHFYSISFIGTQDFLQGVKNHLETIDEVFKTGYKHLYKDSRTKNTWSLNYSSLDTVKSFCEIILHDCPVFHEEKYSRYLLMKDNYFLNEGV
ncbi:LAGLIDADG family homing endonuclease [Fictibacillus sp. 26RED30]|uniref:LAGLIDADG family homing endonuclease n=1 Tax=Fictibacillus sp. 26RED30 TaxID=2745877 RepID=UPI0018CE091A|nr:LAGLIDADG family homing endonuclease [Fictibacillus sp. 26RED30]MBH0159642.1 LAGLIDADG family homing endonuclease [Fictibacillus sp. 26RED30]